MLIVETNNSYGCVSLATLKAAIKQIEKHNTAKLPDADINITFEYLIGSFFPTITNNIQNEMKRQYTLGYIAGQKDKKDDINDN